MITMLDIERYQNQIAVEDLDQLLKPGSYNSSRCTYLYNLNCAYPVRASLNSLYIPLGVLPVAEICATLE